MKDRQKSRVWIRLEVDPDGVCTRDIRGRVTDVTEVLGRALCEVCMEVRKEDVTRGELREAILQVVGEQFDAVWQKETGEGARE